MHVFLEVLIGIFDSESNVSSFAGRYELSVMQVSFKTNTRFLVGELPYFQGPGFRAKPRKVSMLGLPSVTISSVFSV